MAPSVFLNGRFLTQSMTGVQRFSIELSQAIDRLMACGAWPETVALLPRSEPRSAAGSAGSFRHLRLKEVGRTRGHLWEQTNLPGAAQGGLLISLGNTAPLLAGRRQVVVIHDAGVFDTPESYSRRFRTWYKTLQRGLVRVGAKIVTVSEFSRRRIATRLGADPARITVIHEGADHVLRVTPDPATMHRYGLQPGKFILAVGSPAMHKNLAQLRETAAALERRGMALAIAGGSNPNVFREAAAPNATERWLGRVSDAELRALYENAACLLFPSHYEGFGLPPVEAMACNCPVAAARGGAVEEVCAEGALYFESHSGAAISDVAERLLDDQTLAGQLRARGRARARMFTWDTTARALCGVIHGLGSA